MNVYEYLNQDTNEKPLDRIVSDGGFCGVFRSVCCIGDSLSSGEFEACDKDGVRSYHDMFDYSWGQFLARDCGCRVYNFSRGGMTAKEYMDSFAAQNGFWDTDKLCQAYIIALGVNDLFGLKQELGSAESICLDDFTKNSDDFAGYYGAIIQRIKAMQPHARFFLVSMPKENIAEDEMKKRHSELLWELSKLFSHTHVIDLYSYCPVHDDNFKKRFYLYGHLNPSGYRLTAKMIESYVDYIIRHNYDDFGQVGFISTPMYDERLDI